MEAGTTRIDQVGRVEGMGLVYILGGGRSAISSSCLVGEVRQSRRRHRHTRHQHTSRPCVLASREGDPSKQNGTEDWDGGPAHPPRARASF